MIPSRYTAAGLLGIATAAVIFSLGWLVGKLTDRDPPEARPHSAAPSHSHADPDLDRHVLQELHTLKDEVRQLKERAATPAKAPVPPALEEVCYQGKPASVWLKKLRDRDPKYRSEAIPPVAAIAQVDARLVPPLVELLHDPVRKVREEATQGLAAVGPAAETAIPALVRADVLFYHLDAALKKIDAKGELTKAAITAALKDKKYEARRTALMLWGMRLEEHKQPADGFDPAVVQLIMLTVLEMLQDHQVVMPEAHPWAMLYRSLFKDKDAAMALGFTYSQVAALLLPDIESNPQNTLTAFISALHSLPESAPKEVAVASEEQEAIIPQGNPQDVLSLFAEAIKHVDPEGKVSVPLLSRALSDERPKVRGHAAVLVQLTGQAKPLLPALIERIKADKNDDVRLKAIAAVAEVGPEADTALPALVGVLEGKKDASQYAALRDAAVAALGKIGAKARDAVPVLLQAMDETLKAAATPGVSGGMPVSSPIVHSYGTMSVPKGPSQIILDALQQIDPKIADEAAKKMITPARHLLLPTMYPGPPSPIPHRLPDQETPEASMSPSPRLPVATRTDVAADRRRQYTTH